MPRPAIEGLYELGHVLYVLEAGGQGFTPNDVASVECFWVSGDMHASSAGFVLRLRDRRLAHVDFRHWHPFEQNEDFSIAVEFLDEEEALPTPSAPEAPPAVWSRDTAHLNRRLQK